MIPAPPPISSSSCVAPRPGPRRRAFALPLVLLLAVVAGLTITMMMERQVNTRLAVNRQIDSYRDHHRTMGVKEVVDQWLKTAGRDLGARLADDGLAFELRISSSESVRILLFDAQGAALRDVSALSGDQRAIAADVAAALAPLPDVPAGTLLRSAGPVEISIASAPVEVLDAVGRAVAGDAGSNFAQTAVARRDGRILQEADLIALCREAGFNTDQVARARMILTTQPRLWRLIAETRVSIPGERDRVLRSGGLVELRQSSGDPWQSAGPFLSWENLPEDDR